MEKRMATRTFRDTAGVEWLIWSVTPGQHTRRPGKTVSTLPDELVEGWLCFESTVGKRRFYPVPPEWETLTDLQLAILCRAAVPVEAVHRVADELQDPWAGGDEARAG
jgi:hypothetical protein